MKRCGLYIRVFTERQAKVEEGLLQVQDELLTRLPFMRGFPWQGGA